MRKKSVLLLLCAVFVGLTTASVSIAKYVVAETPLSETNLTRLTHIGTLPAVVEPILGRGDGQPFPVALDAITPDDWHIKVAQSQSIKDMKTTVDWLGADYWVLALHTILSQVDATAVLDWDNKTLTLTFPQIYEETEDGEIIIPVPEPVIPIWAIEVEDRTIKRSLKRWVSDWNEMRKVELGILPEDTVETSEALALFKPMALSWEASDFPVIVEAEIQDTMENAIIVVVKSLAGSESPITVIFNKNVIRIIPEGNHQ